MEYYISDTNQKTHGSNDSPNETDVYTRNLGKKHKNEQDEEPSENTPEISDSIK